MRAGRGKKGEMSKRGQEKRQKSQNDFFRSGKKEEVELTETGKRRGEKEGNKW